MYTHIQSCHQCEVDQRTIILNLPCPQYWCLKCIETSVMRDMAMERPTPEPPDVTQAVEQAKKLLAEPECERCQCTNSDVVQIDVPGDGPRDWCPECISGHMSALDDLVQFLEEEGRDD